MGGSKTQVVRCLTGKPELDLQGVLTGKVIGLVQGGMPLVEVPGSGRAVLVRRCLQNSAPATGDVPAAGIGSEVLIVCEGGDPDRAVLIGVLSDLALSPAGEGARSSPPPRAARIDGRTVVLEAESQIVLRCGKGSLTLTADGRIVLKGVEITSRALRQHKIKGATVNIN